MTGGRMKKVKASMRGDRRCWPSRVLYLGSPKLATVPTSTNQNIVKRTDNHKRFFNVREHELTYRQKPFILRRLKTNVDWITECQAHGPVLREPANHHFDFE